MMWQVAILLKTGGDELKLVVGDDENQAFLNAVSQFGRSYGENCYGIVVRSRVGD